MRSENLADPASARSRLQEVGNDCGLQVKTREGTRVMNGPREHRNCEEAANALITIRPFAQGDVEAVQAIEAVAQWQGDRCVPARFEAFSTRVAEIDGQMVGFACH